MPLYSSAVRKFCCDFTEKIPIKFLMRTKSLFLPGKTGTIKSNKSLIKTHAVSGNFKNDSCEK